MFNFKRAARQFRIWRGDTARKAKRRRALKSWLGLLKLAVFIACIGGVGYAVDRTVPPQHLIWRPLSLDAPTGFATRSQLLRVSLSPNATCRALALGAPAMNSVPAEPKSVAGEPCGWDTARIYYGSDSAPLSPGEATMQCPLSLGSYIWSQQIDRIAQREFGSSLAQTYHAGTYSCRRQRGNGSGAWSEHAFANAFDVTGFRLADGTVISVLEHWNGTAPQQRFLRGVRDEACKIFRVTLSPDYNAAHADHFHVDMGPHNSCR